MELYRDQVAQAWEKLPFSRELSPGPEAGERADRYPHASRTPERGEWTNLFEWRSRRISTTRLPAIVPFVLLVFWLAMIVVYLSTR